MWPAHARLGISGVAKGTVVSGMCGVGPKISRTSQLFQLLPKLAVQYIRRCKLVRSREWFSSSHYETLSVLTQTAEWAE